MDSALKVPTNTGYYENSYLSQVEYRNKRIE